MADKKWKSCAIWPDHTCDSLNNYTEDFHDTEDQAMAVCDMLCRDGFGGTKEIFPLTTAVDPVREVKDA